MRGVVLEVRGDGMRILFEVLDINSSRDNILAALIL